MACYMRRRCSAITLVAAVLMSFIGADLAFAKSSVTPTCCRRAAHLRKHHCAGMGEPSIPAHHHPERYFLSGHERCQCCMGLAQGVSAIPVGKSALIALFSSGASLGYLREQLRLTSPA